MAESDRRTPFYQTVEGITIPGCFHKDVFLSGLHYEPKAGDLFIASYPKLSPTWIQMIVFLIRNKGKPAGRFNEMIRKMPYLELHGSKVLQDPASYYAIRVHLQFDRTPHSPKAKYIYVASNPKSDVVSSFNRTRCKSYLYEDGEFDVYFDLFMEGKVDFGDYFDHVLSWYEHRNDENVLFLTYEDVKADLRGTVLKIARFMGHEYGWIVEEFPEVLDMILMYSSVHEVRKLLSLDVSRTVRTTPLTAAVIDSSPIPLGVKTVQTFLLEHQSPESKQILKPKTEPESKQKPKRNLDPKVLEKILMYSNSHKVKKLRSLGVSSRTLRTTTLAAAVIDASQILLGLKNEKRFLLEHCSLESKPNLKPQSEPDSKQNLNPQSEPESKQNLKFQSAPESEQNLKPKSKPESKQNVPTLTDEQVDRIDKKIQEKLYGTELYEQWKTVPNENIWAKTSKKLLKKTRQELCHIS